MFREFHVLVDAIYVTSGWSVGGSVGSASGAPGASLFGGPYSWGGPYSAGGWGGGAP